jgi:TPR repeat protein
MWIRKAAEQGDSFAQYHLGSLLNGLGQALPTNPFESFTWWLKSAEGGFAVAQNNVGYLYEQGEIIGQDYVEAHKWMSLAAAQGYEGADEHSNAMALKMSAEQREESQRRIEAFKIRPEEKDQSQDCGIIERLAKMGDHEAQAMLAWQRSRTISSEVRREVWRRDEGKCVKCGSRERLEYDHIIPFSEGGSNTTRNIELLCESCNRAKSDSVQ